LIEEYQAAGTTTAAYVYGAGGLILDNQFNYYYQDGSGSTSHLADLNGHLQEWYRYDLQGTPVFYNAGDTQISASAHSVRHLFTGQQWYSDISLYDLRNRFYSPDLGRFLQPDPIGFRGDRTNLYRYVTNNPVTRRDPSGLEILNIKAEFGDSPGEFTIEPVIVTAPFENPVDFNPYPGSFPGFQPDNPTGPGEPNGPGGGGRDKQTRGGPVDNKTPKDNTPSPNPTNPQTPTNQTNQPSANPSSPPTPNPVTTPDPNAFYEGTAALSAGIFVAGLATGDPVLMFVGGGIFILDIELWRGSQNAGEPVEPAPGGP
jgi:RHS repeat-associated protein